MLVRIDRIPASRDADTTIFQSTSEITAALPIEATAIWQTV